MKISSSPRRSQEGISLVISLIILVVVTLLGLSVVNTSVFEERMAGNTRDRTLAFESAEYAMREAGDFLSGAVLPPFTAEGGATGAYFRNLNTSPNGETEEAYWRDTHAWASKSVAATESAGVLVGQAQPRYVIEEYPAISCAGYSKKWPPPPPRNIYRVTARGVGRTTEAVVILQSWFDRGCG